jgi:hypothetical protein
MEALCSRNKIVADRHSRLLSPVQEAMAYQITTTSNAASGGGWHVREET